MRRLFWWFVVGMAAAAVWLAGGRPGAPPDVQFLLSLPAFLLLFFLPGYALLRLTGLLREAPFWVRVPYAFALSLGVAVPPVAAAFWLRWSVPVLGLVLLAEGALLAVAAAFRETGKPPAAPTPHPSPITHHPSPITHHSSLPSNSPWADGVLLASLAAVLLVAWHFGSEPAIDTYAHKRQVEWFSRARPVQNHGVLFRDNSRDEIPDPVYGDNLVHVLQGLSVFVGRAEVSTVWPFWAVLFAPLILLGAAALAWMVTEKPWAGALAAAAASLMLFFFAAQFRLYDLRCSPYPNRIAAYILYPCLLGLLLRLRHARGPQAAQGLGVGLIAAALFATHVYYAFMAFCLLALWGLTLLLLDRPALRRLAPALGLAVLLSLPFLGLKIRRVDTSFSTGQAMQHAEQAGRLIRIGRWGGLVHPAAFIRRGQALQVVAVLALLAGIARRGGGHKELPGSFALLALAPLAFLFFPPLVLLLCATSHWVAVAVLRFWEMIPFAAALGVSLAGLSLPQGTLRRVVVVVAGSVYVTLVAALILVNPYDKLRESAPDAAARFVAGHCDERDVVLSDMLVGYRLWGYTRVPVVSVSPGHGQTEARWRDMLHFFSPLTSDQARFEILRRRRVTYVVYHRFLFPLADEFLRRYPAVFERQFTGQTDPVEALYGIDPAHNTVAYRVRSLPPAGEGEENALPEGARERLAQQGVRAHPACIYTAPPPTEGGPESLFDGDKARGLVWRHGAMALLLFDLGREVRQGTMSLHARLRERDWASPMPAIGMVQSLEVATSLDGNRWGETLCLVNLDRLSGYQSWTAPLVVNHPVRYVGVVVTSSHTVALRLDEVEFRSPDLSAPRQAPLR